MIGKCELSNARYWSLCRWSTENAEITVGFRREVAGLT